MVALPLGVPAQSKHVLLPLHSPHKSFVAFPKAVPAQSTQVLLPLQTPHKSYLFKHSHTLLLPQSHCHKEFLCNPNKYYFHHKLHINPMHMCYYSNNNNSYIFFKRVGHCITALRTSIIGNYSRIIALEIHVKDAIDSPFDAHITAWTGGKI